MNDINIMILGASGRIANSLIRFFRLETNHRLILLSNFPEKLPRYEGYDYQKTDFIRWVLYKLEQGFGFEIVNGQFCNPTYTEDIAVVVNKVISKKRYGIYHAGGPDWLSRYDIAVKTARIFSQDETLIKPINPSQLEQSAKRPNKGGLVTLKAQTDLGIEFTSLESGLMTLKQSMRDSRFTFVMKGG